MADNNEQLELFSLTGDITPTESNKMIKVINASFIETINSDWKELFSGFDELYAITFSSGFDFVNNVVSLFMYSILMLYVVVTLAGLGIVAYSVYKTIGTLF